MKRARLTHEVWMGFPNHEGTIQSISVIASFCSKQRAMDYLKVILDEHPYEDAYSPRYGYKEKGDEYVQIADQYDGKLPFKVFLGGFREMQTDGDGYGYIPMGVR